MDLHLAFLLLAQPSHVRAGHFHSETADESIPCQRQRVGSFAIRRSDKVLAIRVLQRAIHHIVGRLYSNRSSATQKIPGVSYDKQLI